MGLGGTCGNIDMKTYLVTAWAWPEVFVGEIKLLDTERTSILDVNTVYSSQGPACSLPCIIGVIYESILLNATGHLEVWRHGKKRAE